MKHIQPSRPLFTIVLAAFFLAAFALQAQSPAAGSKAPSAIRVGLLKGPTGICLIRLSDAQFAAGEASAKGQDTLAPLPEAAACPQVAVTLLPSVDLMLSKVSNGEVDFAALPPNTLAKLNAKGMPWNLAAVTGNGMLSFITSNAVIRRPADLKGREVCATGQGAVPEYVFRSILSRYSLQGDDVSFRFNLPYPEAAMALASGKVESALLPEPFATLALQANPALKVPFDVQAEYAMASGEKSYPISVLAVSGAFARARGDDAKKLLAFAAASIDWVKANPDRAATLVEARDFGLKAPVAKASIPRSNFSFALAKAARGQVETLLRHFLRQAPESIGGALPPDSFYAF